MKKKETEKSKVEEINIIGKYSGTPMSEESYEEWQKVFSDIEEVSKRLKEVEF